MKHFLIKLCYPTSPEIRNKNKETLLMCEKIRNTREGEIISGLYSVKTKYQLNKSFLDYFKTYRDNYKKKNYRAVHAVYSEFSKFIQLPDISFNQITSKLMREFRDHLEVKYRGETASCYFSKFKRVIKNAMMEDFLVKDPCYGLAIKRSASIKKEVLTIDEIKLLAKTECGSEEVKRAFLFACISGLRMCDIRALKYSNVKAKTIQFVQSKTGGEVTVPISKTIKTLIGERKDDLDSVFNLPSHTAVSKDLETWIKKAEIKKHITFHCARHSFGTNLIRCGTDVFVASKLLGHTDLKQTSEYVRIVQSEVRKASEKFSKKLSF